MYRRLRRTLLLCLFAAGIPFDAAHAAMVTPGQFSVSESGAATYTIPIQVPPGTAGIEPKLALTYSSQAGNGLLGVGWSLSGLSAIGRCPRTMAQDGVRGAVNYDMHDRYCLDGQRLMAIKGIDGADGTEYRTERDSFSKIVSYGSTGNGPAWFSVWTKAGQVMEYGITANSRIEARGKTAVRAWALNKLQDTKSNYLTVTYTEDSTNGDFYPLRIDYTGNANVNAPTSNSVQFFYEARPDTVVSVLSEHVVRLFRIQTYATSAPGQEYVFAYEKGPVTQRSRPVAIRECSVNGCLPSIKFVWENAAPVAQNWTWTGHGVGDAGWQLADLFGDGRQVYWTHSNNGTHYATRFLAAPPDHMTSIVSGLGAATEISYKPLTDPTVYTKDRIQNEESRSIIDLQIPLYVVSSVLSSNGIGGTLTTNYKYGGLKADLNGRGLLGFRWMAATQADTGLSTRTEYRQDFPYTGLPALVKKTIAGGGNGGVLGQSTTSYACLNPADGSACVVGVGKRYFPYAQSSREAGWDLNGAALPTITTSSQYDLWGNPTRIVVSSGDGYSKTTSNTYTNNAANWHLGRLIKAIVTSTTP